ncbi:MAG: hypothetical protein FWC16_06200 [Defluviitaleaceae bacterium]|nr:hypothetical protein [Defluviitaleaceae bacterium]MCL2274500.1 hypothetical protein [Defluviitaleaceae bacterium]
MQKLIARYKQTDPKQRNAGGNILKFLAILLAFTLIAQGTSGATMARVALASPERGEIIDAISAHATIHAADRLHLYVPAGLRITQMHVNTGQPLQAGQPVAAFDLENLYSVYTRESANLQRLQRDLANIAANGESPIETAQRNLSRAHADYTQTVQQSEADIRTAQDALNALARPEALRSHERAMADYYAAKAQGEAEVSAALYQLQNTPDEAALRSQARAEEDYAQTRARVEADIAAAYTHYNTVRRGTQVDRTAVENAQRNAQRAREDYQATVQQSEDAIRNAENALLDALRTGNASLEEIALLQQAIAAAQATAQANHLAVLRRVEDAETALSQAQRGVNAATQNEREQASNALENIRQSAENNLQTARRRVEDAAAVIAQALAQAQTAYENAQARAAENIRTAQRRTEDTASALYGDTRRAHTTLQTAITNAAQNRQQARRRVEDAELALSNAVLQAEDASILNHINATTLQLDIAEKYALVESLRMLLSTNGVFYAPKAGAVAFVRPVGEITSASPLIILRDVYGGFYAVLSVPRTQAERLRIGSESSVTTGGGSFFFVPTVTGTVSAIANPCENDRVQVTITLPEGNWHEGQRVEAQVILHRANYDLSVPISAVHSDNTGHFLLVITQRNTVMGVQNVVARVNVTVLASDRYRASVWGAIDRTSQVITGSNTPVAVGDRIRVA